MDSYFCALVSFALRICSSFWFQWCNSICALTCEEFWRIRFETEQQQQRDWMKKILDKKERKKKGRTNKDPPGFDTSKWCLWRLNCVKLIHIPACRFRAIFSTFNVNKIPFFILDNLSFDH